MKKMLLPLAVLALAATSCDTSTKDSFSKVTFYEYSLITDKTDPSQPAQVSATSYDVKLNWTQNTAEVSTSDLVISNQKRSFETQPMELKMGYLVQEGTTNYVEYYSFESYYGADNSLSSTLNSLSGGFGYLSYIYSGIYVPGFESATPSNTRMRLLMTYDLNDQYRVQTFWPECFYGGTTNVINDTNSHSSQNTIYRIQLDFEKNTAKCVIYNPSLSAEDSNMPKALVLEDIAISFTNTDYYLHAFNPTLKVVNDKNLLVTAQEYANEVGQPFWVSDFTLYPIPTDLTRASISYNLNGYSANFSGASAVQVSNPQ